MRRRAAPYALAVGLVAASSAIARLSDAVGPGFAWVFDAYAPLWLGLAVVGVGLVAGRGPAIAAALLAPLLGWYLFLPPAYSFRLDEWAAAALSLFTLCSLVAAVVLTRPARQADEPP